MNCRIKWMWLMVVISFALVQVGAQVLSGDELKKVVPNSFFFAGQSAPVQL
jgi:hypothetical protein